MQKQLLVFFFAAFLILGGCGDASSADSSTGPDLPVNSEKTPSGEAKKTSEPGKVVEPTAEPTASMKITREMLATFIQDGYELMDWKEGDLNRDAYPDVVLISRNENEGLGEDSFDNPLPRPVILLLGDAQNKLTEADRNPNIALCYECGGMMGDPHAGISIKDGYFSIEHYGGSSWRWTRIITFKYAEAEKTWYLHKDGGESYNTGDPDKVEVEVLTEKDFGKVKFADFGADN